MDTKYTAMPEDPEDRTRQARNAFDGRDVQLSKQVHATKKAAPHAESSSEEGKYLKPIIFGGLDGISTIFAFLAGAVGAELTLSSIIALGCAQLFAGAFGMGFGEYLSSEAERQVAKREESREEWEVENHPQGEIDEMVQIYIHKGLTEVDAVNVAKTLSKYKDFWVEHMMLTEIGMMPPDGDYKEALVQGVVMFLSFFLLGALPLITYVVTHTQENSSMSFKVSCGSAVVSLFLLGVLKARAADMPIFSGGSYMAIQGALSAGGAYLIGSQLPLLL